MVQYILPIKEGTRMLENYILSNPWFLIIVGLYYWIYRHKLDFKSRFIQELKYTILLCIGLAYSIVGILGFYNGGENFIQNILEHIELELHIAILGLSFVFLLKNMYPMFFFIKEL